MANRQDIQLLNNDLIIQNLDGVYGNTHAQNISYNMDLVYDNSDGQHIIDTINAFAGWWKENFTDGVGLQRYLKSNNTQELTRKITLCLQADGYNASPIVALNSNGQLTINPNVNL
jgi:hypothetical protein